jgi:hypothetical protein
LNVVESARLGGLAGMTVPSKEVEEAARTLLDLYATLLRARASGEELRGVVGEIRKDEPYI